MNYTEEQLETMQRAAPDMLEALENLTEILNSMYEDPELVGAYKVHYDINDIREARFVIAKAKGESQ